MSTFGDFVYGKARATFGSTGIALVSSPVNAMLVTAGYSPQPNVDQFVSSIPAGAIVVRNAVLTSPGMTSFGAYFGTIPPFNALTGPAPVVALVLYVNTGSDATSTLLYYSSSGSGFPFLPQGFNYVVGFDQSNGGFFQA